MNKLSLMPASVVSLAYVTVFPQRDIQLGVPFEPVGGIVGQTFVSRS